MTLAKRAFDVTCSAGGLLVLSPLLLVIAGIVVAQDGGPPIFSQQRVGRSGALFRMFKFRTMVQGADRKGLSLTVGRDSRITPIGRVLRKMKLDELPQLWNVLRGDMSLVGPRPEVTVYVNQYSPEQQRVLQLIPGITDPASIAYADESDVLARSTDPEHTYVHSIMPDKIRLNLEYAATASVWKDLFVILGTLRRVSQPARNPTAHSTT